MKITVDGEVLVRNGMKTAPANTGGVKAADSNGGVAGSNTLYGNGNHNLSIADVDGDGCDEILWGSAALDNDGTLLYATGYGHGDAIHVGKMIPDSDRPVCVRRARGETESHPWLMGLAQCPLPDELSIMADLPMLTTAEVWRQT